MPSVSLPHPARCEEWTGCRRTEQNYEHPKIEHAREQLNVPPTRGNIRILANCWIRVPLRSLLTADVRRARCDHSSRTCSKSARPNSFIARAVIQHTCIRHRRLYYRNIFVISKWSPLFNVSMCKTKEKSVNVLYIRLIIHACVSATAVFPYTITCQGFQSKI